MPKRAGLYALILAGVGIAAVLAVRFWPASGQAYATRELRIDDTRLSLQLADTPDKQRLGLSNRQAMDRDEGMLFAFERPAEQCFWMKDMRFPLDMIWLDADKRVVKVQADARPETYPDNFCSPADKPAQYVIELNAGRAGELKLPPGRQLSF